MKKETIIMYALPILCAVAAIIAYIGVRNNKPVETKKEDSIVFKEEYEEFNDGSKLDMDIPEDNPFVYADYDKLLEIITNGTGIIYLGFPRCPWCRNAIPVLIDAANDAEVETIYYMNILNERDSFVVEDKKLVYATDEDGNEKKGTEGYHKLLKALDKHLTEYVVSFEGKEYKTGEKRIYAPSIIFVRDGKILGVHVSTVDSQENPKDGLTEEQYDELYDIYDDYITKTKGGTCSIGTSC